MVLAVVSCGSLNNPANGQVSTIDNVYQSTASYTCDTGYTLNGNHTTRICQDNGQWSGSIPNCSRKSELNFYHAASIY